MISHFFIDRPIFASVLSIVITLAGALAVWTLPVDQYPPIAPPTVQVNCTYPGANAQVVADTIAAPIEQQVNGVENMLYMASTSGNDGTYAMTATFDIGTDLNTALVLVQNRVALAVPQLPDVVQRQGVIVRKKSPAILLVINIFSPDQSYDDIYLSNFSLINIKDEISRVEGVGDIFLFGQHDYSIRCWLDPDKLAYRNLTGMDVAAAIQNQNQQVSAGQFGQQPAPADQTFQLPIDALGRLSTPEQFGDIVIKSEYGKNGGPSQLVRLKDVARIELGAQQNDQRSTLDGNPASGIGVFQLPGSNALDTANRIRSKMKELQDRFPPGVSYEIAYDTTPFIRESVNDVVRTLRDAVLLVALVVLVFLQNWRATVIPLIAVPVAIVGTFAFLALFGFTLNNLTLFGLVLAIGIVVDDAIVVVENVERWLDQGLKPKAAARKAMEEVTGPVIAVALVLCAVFVPCAFISGITGQFFRQFAITISVSTVLSAFNSLTLSPALAAIMLKPHDSSKLRAPLPRIIFALGGAAVAYVWLQELPFIDVETRIGEAALVALSFGGAVAGWWLGRFLNRALGWSFGRFNKGFDASTHVYAKAVGILLHFRVTSLVIYGGLLVLTYWSFKAAPGGFIPAQDKGRVLLNVQLPEAASVQRTNDLMDQVRKIVRETPGVAHTVDTSGRSFLLNANASNYGSFFVVFDSFANREEAELNGFQISNTLRKRFASEIKDAVVTVMPPPPVDGIGNAGGFKLMVEDRTALGIGELQKQTDKLVKSLRKEKEIANAFTLSRTDTPQLFADIDRTKVKAMRIPYSDVSQTLQIYLGSLFVNQFNAFGRTWQVNIQADAPFRIQPSTINRLKVRNEQGKMAPLGAVVDMKDIVGPSIITRYNLYTATTINGTSPQSVSSGQAIKAVEDIAVSTLPQSMVTEWTEMAFMEKRAGNTGIYVFVLAVVFVFLVLAALYESWSLPLAVILVVPMCLLSSVVGVLLTPGMDVNIFTQIGFVVLVGLASKNAILIVEFAKVKHDEGEPLMQATLEACRLRLRPILMTSFAFILGVVPLVLAQGAGAEMRRALGVAVFSGMIGVTFFGIFLTPVFFYVIQSFDDLHLGSRFKLKYLRSAAIIALNIPLLGIPYMLRNSSSIFGRRRKPSAPLNGNAEPPRKPSEDGTI